MGWGKPFMESPTPDHRRKPSGVYNLQLGVRKPTTVKNTQHKP